MPRLHSGAANDRPETTNLLLSLIPDVVWQQPQETHLTNFHKISITETHKSTHMPEFKLRIYVETQTSPMKETSPQVSGSSTEPLLGNHTRRTPLQNLNDAKKRQPEIQRHEMSLTANETGDDNISTS